MDEIEAADFDLIEATDADDAISILEIGTDVRIVFTDVDMPGSMDGLRIASEIRDRWPPIEIIVTSGQRDVLASELPTRGLYFSKPNDWGKITAAMNRFAGTISSPRRFTE